MNCEEFHSQISEGKHEAEAAAVQHLEVCSECRALAHRDKELQRSLAVVRESAPAIPGSLDASVMSAYRSSLAANRTRTGKLRILRPLVWSAVAASLVIALAILISHRKPATPSGIVSAPSPVDAAKEYAKQESPTAAATTVSSKKRAHAPIRRPKPSQSPVTVAARDPRTNGFQNLMFCDPLSCPGPMQVIRIQVPASRMNRVPAWRPSNGMVQADVVVGSDGIARAIRIVR